MHDSVLEFGRRHLTEAVVSGAHVVEVGALDVNGSLRPHVAALGPASYTGVDRQDGPGVDVVGDVSDATLPRKADVVICTEVLEHAEDWRAVVRAVQTIARVGGLVLVTARGPGFGRHEFPDDHWRFTVDDFRRMFAGWTEVELVADPQPGHPGVLGAFRRPRRSADVDLGRIRVRPAPER